MSSTQQITIREMTAADIPNVKALIKQAFGEEGDAYLSHYPIPSRAPIVIAEHDKKLIGAAAIYRNSLHPYWVAVLVAVAEPYRRQGLGRKLHDAVLHAQPLETHHLGTKGDYRQDNKSAEAFLFAMGYQLTLDCHCVEWTIENFDFTRYLAVRSQSESRNLSVSTLEALFLAPAKRQEAFDFLVSKYTEEHFWSPPHSKDYPKWEEIVFSRILPEMSFALLEGDRVVGVVTAGMADNDTLDIIWGYISRQYATDEAVGLLKYLFAHQFKAACDGRATPSEYRGLYKADLEIDTTDEVLSTLLNWLPICNDKVWRILQKPRTLPNY